MLSHLSSNVVSAKTRAIYGRRLTAQNYQEILNCKNVTEIARYLATSTDYDKVLAGINDREVHRGQLESRLKQKLLAGSAALCRHETSISGALVAYLLQRSEVDQILNALLYLNADKTKEYSLSIPATLAVHPYIDLVRLSGTDNFDSIIVALACTPYQALLESLRPICDNPIDFTVAENALNIYLYNRLYETIEHLRYKGTKQDLRQIAGLYLDLNDFARILRLRTYFQADPDHVHSSLLPFGSLNKGQIEKVIRARDAGEARMLLTETRIGKKTSRIEYNFADQLAERAPYNVCRHGVHFSVYASVVMLSYISCLQIELTDVINTVEGIHCHLPPEEIKKLLAFSGF